MKKIAPDTLVALDKSGPPGIFRIDVAYARENNFLFGERIYRPDARLWLYKDLADIVIKAADNCFKNYNLRYVLYDGLRTIDAQEAMLQTQKVRDNPHWLEEPRLLSPPGAGGHPRGMAVDIGLETLDGKFVDMGTPFDCLAEDSSPDKNPAHRNHKNLPAAIRRNRAILDDTMTEAARSLSLALFPLPQEWWDFRLPPEFFNAYPPLRDSDLPPEMRMMG